MNNLYSKKKLGFVLRKLDIGTADEPHPALTGLTPSEAASQTKLSTPQLDEQE